MSTQQPKSDEEATYRDRDQLRRVWEEADSVQDVARHFEISHTTASRWLDKHGLRERGEECLANMIHRGKIDGREIDPLRGGRGE